MRKSEFDKMFERIVVRAKLEVTRCGRTPDDAVYIAAHHMAAREFWIANREALVEAVKENKG